MKRVVFRATEKGVAICPTPGGPQEIGEPEPEE